eukprot:m.335750 g.335750  ORF g.335750 m.335750 type:complete len:352 (+) comp17668_c0_seq1:229-1284(+)
MASTMSLTQRDDWLTAVEESADTLNAQISNNDTRNPFMLMRPQRQQPTPPNSRNTLHRKQHQQQQQPTHTQQNHEIEKTLERQQQQQQNNAFPRGSSPVGRPAVLRERQIQQPPTTEMDTTKENLRPTQTGRRRRRLPSLGDQQGRMRKAISLGALPSSSGRDGDFNRPRRKLPDPEQGKLIRQVADQLEEEAQVRLQVARELKEEKRKRWKAEDEVTERQQENNRLKNQLNEKKEGFNQIVQELEEERRLRHDAEEQAAEMEKELKRVRGELQRVRDELRGHEAMNGEETLEEAWRQTYEEKRRRQIAEERLKTITSRILKKGGKEILRQLLPEEELERLNSDTPETPNP